MENNINFNIVILGGGQAAAHAATTIRQEDESSSLAIITNENYLPYERPPLSKSFLSSLLNSVNLDEPKLKILLPSVLIIAKSKPSNEVPHMHPKALIGKFLCIGSFIRQKTRYNRFKT